MGDLWSEEYAVRDLNHAKRMAMLKNKIRCGQCKGLGSVSNGEGGMKPCPNPVHKQKRSSNGQ